MTSRVGDRGGGPGGSRFGYRAADYRGVEPLFGTLADFDRLLAAAQERGLRLPLDFVPTGTSSRLDAPALRQRVIG